MTMHFVRLRIEGDDFPDAVLFFSAADPVQASVRAFAFADRMQATHVSSGEVSAESIDWMMKQLEADAERRDELMARLGGDILRGMDVDKVMRWSRLADASREQFKRGAMPELYAYHPGGIYKTPNDEANRDLLKRLGARVREGDDGQLEFGLPPGQFKVSPVDPPAPDGPAPETD